MSYSLIALGSNLGDRRTILQSAVEELQRQVGLSVVRCSRWYETAPVGGPTGQQPFLNGAALLETACEPQCLFSVLKQVESQLGRIRRERWGPRTLDLDLLLYDDLQIKTPHLVIPHPRMAWRRFVLEPAAEIAPAMIHPQTGWTIQALLDYLNSAPNYVAIAGAIGAGKTLLAERLAQLQSGRFLADPAAPTQHISLYCDPSGTHWKAELQLVRKRAELLSVSRPGWHQRLTVSDFWFDESIAVAHVRLPIDRFHAFRRRWQALRQGVVRPKLIVLLQSPAEELLRQVPRGDEQGENNLSADLLDEIQQATRDRALQPNQGPLLLLRSDNPDRVLAEICAALDSMR
ncbi:MAG: 2-amino-4-hydroxy-6-hydroxymethyldihydropteridine diphosphokinase [Rhodopirellula sp.]|nr:2-amino-4-hydroxy-6-hydroxymethyldihydropteridine diphosphokinase [Rhodopirellula sp.]